MADPVREFGTATLFESEGNWSDTSVRHNFVLADKLSPTPQSGDFVTFTNGTRFRKATARTVSDSRITLGSPQHTEATKLTFPEGTKASVSSSPGGYTGDRIFFSPLALVDSGGLFTRTSGPSIPTLLRNQAVTKALNDIAGQKANIGEDLATMRATVGLMTHPFSAFKALHKELSKAKRTWSNDLLRKNARSFGRGEARGAAAAYIAWVYGIKPIMQDVHGLMELAKDKGNAPLLVHGLGKAKESVTTDPLSSWPDNHLTEVSGTTVDARVRVNLWAQVDPESRGLRALNQLGLLNPVSLAWDLVSWSFVVDWFVPIGPVLSALSAPAGLKFVDGSISNRIKARATYKDLYTQYKNPPKLAWDSSNEAATGTWHYDGYIRETFVNWPLPGLYYDSDPFRGDRPLKALALLILNLRSLR